MEIRKKILLVDDEEEALFYLSNIVRRQGFDVSTAVNGEDAIKLAKKLKPAMVVLDIIMPGMDGGEVVLALEEDEATKNIPVIFLSAILDRKEWSLGRKTGSHYIIPKPVVDKELLDAIDKVFSK